MWIARLFKRQRIEETRTSGRLKTVVEVILIVAGDRKPAKLVEISNKGARLITDFPPRMHERVVFEWEAKPFSGRVAWVRGKRFGLSLDGPDRRWQG